MSDEDIKSISDQEDEYTVETIRTWRYNLNEKRKEYNIKWENYPESDNTWEPQEHLIHCPEKIKEFEATLSPEDQKYYHCERPEKLNGFQRNATFIRRVGVDGPHESDDEGSGKQQKRQRFYILARFHDSNYAEEITLDEFLRYRPEEAIKFCEERFLYRRTDSSGGRSDSERTT